MDVKKVFMSMTGETNDEVVSSFTDLAKERVLSETNRIDMMDELYVYQLKLSLAMYNRNGDEGKSSASEGGVSDTYESEETILKGIEKYRLSAVARRLLDEKKKNEELSAS